MGLASFIMQFMGTIQMLLVLNVLNHYGSQDDIAFERILENGYAYESEGSVYFDVAKYNKDHRYGILSNRNIDDMLNTTRELDGQQEKRNPVDFALWKKAQPEHIMRWPSP